MACASKRTTLSGKTYLVTQCASQKPQQIMSGTTEKVQSARRLIISKKSLFAFRPGGAGGGSGKKYSLRYGRWSTAMLGLFRCWGDDRLSKWSWPINLPLRNSSQFEKSYADSKFKKLQEYYSFMNGRMKEQHNPTERKEILQEAQKRLLSFIDDHISDIKRLLYSTDIALMSMVMLKLNKKMDTSEAKIRNLQAMIPFGLYTSPEFKCLGTSYYIVSAHNQEDAQMILSSERKPHCYTFRGTFAWGGFYHRHSEATYVGPHAEHFSTADASQGLYCHADDVDTQCIYKINPREEFPESVEYEPKVSYWCGPQRYFLPATTDIRCIFSIFSMNFVLRFAYDGVTYKSSDLSFMYQNGQVFYTDEPWAGMSCWNWACKWRHNQNQRGNEFFVN